MDNIRVSNDTNYQLDSDQSDCNWSVDIVNRERY